MVIVKNIKDSIKKSTAGANTETSKAAEEAKSGDEFVTPEKSGGDDEFVTPEKPRTRPCNKVVRFQWWMGRSEKSD